MDSHINFVVVMKLAHVVSGLLPRFEISSNAVFLVFHHVRISVNIVFHLK